MRNPGEAILQGHFGRKRCPFNRFSGIYNHAMQTPKKFGSNPGGGRVLNFELGRDVWREAPNMALVEPISDQWQIWRLAELIV